VLGFIAGAVLSPAIIVAVLYVYVKSQIPSPDVVVLQPPDIPKRHVVDLDWNVQDLDGEEINLLEEFGGKAIFLNVWATWCRPCVNEMPGIEKLYQRFKHRIAFACVSDEKIQTLREFRDRKGYSLPIYHSKAGTQPAEFQAGAIPASFIISRERRIELKHIGSADWSHETVAAFLETFADSVPEQSAGADAHDSSAR
jgi:thiol-disulfide isomerase/thioredoxin